MSELRLGGVAASELAQHYGTPLLAIDFDTFGEAIARFCDAARPHGIEVAYAGKALLLVAIAEHLVQTTLHLDVSSLGELVTAERAGFPAPRMTLHGCGKTGEELRAAMDGRVGRVVVDNLDELRRFAAMGDAGVPCDVLLRVNTGIEAHTHEFVRTAGARTKFGFDPQALPDAASLLLGIGHLRFRGLHGHIGSQIFEAEPFLANAAALVESAVLLEHMGLRTEQIVVGGGFGVPMDARDERAIDVAAVLGAISRLVREESQRQSIATPRLGIEPGRALIAQAGTTLYEVAAVKRSFERPYAIVDGGIFENPRPALYGAEHPVVFAGAREAAQLQETTVCGRSCENDELAQAMLPEDLQAGDLLAMRATGAYTYSMASNYNRFARPAVVAVSKSEHRLIARRETVDDLIRHDVEK